MKFTETTAVVTGAASGIGAALARRLAEGGAQLVLADIDTPGLARFADELRTTGAAVVDLPTDVADYEQVAQLAERAQAAFGDVHLLVNNAGIELTGALWEISPERWQHCMDVNVTGVFNGIRAFLPRMVAATLIPSRVLNLASVGAVTTAAFQTPYIASKHAVLAMTESLDLELQLIAPHVRASAALPGPVQTNIFNAGVTAADSGEGTRQEMAHLLREGMATTEAADIILDGVAKGQLWIFTHPDAAHAAIRRRSHAILEREIPTPR